MKLTFKQYGDWLFEDISASSIIYEKYIISDSELLTEVEGKRLYESLIREGWFDWIDDSILDWTQLGLGVLGFFPVVGTVANAANVAISFSREDYLGVALGTIGLIPAIGGAIAGLGGIIRVMAGGARAVGAVGTGGRIGTILARFAPIAERLLGFLTTVQRFFSTYSTAIVNIFRSAAGAGEVVEAIPSILRPIQNLVRNPSVRGFLTGAANNTIVNGISRGFQMLGELFVRIRDILTRLISSPAAGAGERIERAGERIGRLVSPETAASWRRSGNIENIMGGASGILLGSDEEAYPEEEYADAEYEEYPEEEEEPGATFPSTRVASGPSSAGLGPIMEVSNRLIYTDTRFKILSGI